MTYQQKTLSEKNAINEAVQRKRRIWKYSQNTQKAKNTKKEMCSFVDLSLPLFNLKCFFILQIFKIFHKDLIWENISENR